MMVIKKKKVICSRPQIGCLSYPNCFCSVMKRVITLINQLAAASGTTAALQAQADNANQTAKKYMDDNDLLKKVGFTLVF